MFRCGISTLLELNKIPQFSDAVKVGKFVADQFNKKQTKQKIIHNHPNELILICVM